MLSKPVWFHAFFFPLIAGDPSKITLKVRTISEVPQVQIIRLLCRPTYAYLKLLNAQVETRNPLAECFSEKPDIAPAMPTCHRVVAKSPLFSDTTKTLLHTIPEKNP